MTTAGTPLTTADLAEITAHYPHPDCTGYRVTSPACVITALLAEIRALRAEHLRETAEPATLSGREGP